MKLFCLKIRTPPNTTSMHWNWRVSIYCFWNINKHLPQTFNPLNLVEVQVKVDTTSFLEWKNLKQNELNRTNIVINAGGWMDLKVGLWIVDTFRSQKIQQRTSAEDDPHRNYDTLNFRCTYFLCLAKSV